MLPNLSNESQAERLHIKHMFLLRVTARLFKVKFKLSPVVYFFLHILQVPEGKDDRRRDRKRKWSAMEGGKNRKVVSVVHTEGGLCGSPIHAYTSLVGPIFNFHQRSTESFEHTTGEPLNLRLTWWLITTQNTLAKLPYITSALGINQGHNEKQTIKAGKDYKSDIKNKLAKI